MAYNRPWSEVKMRPSRKPPQVQAAVFIKSMNGENDTKIAKDLGISRQTVIKILNDEELNKLAQAGKQGIYELIPDSIAAYAHHIKNKSIPEATTVLRATGVLPQEQAEGASGPAVNVNLGVFGDRE